MDAITVSSWEGHFESLFDDHVGTVFPRRDLRHQARGYVRGLLGSVDRKSSWQLAEHLGQEKPFTNQPSTTSQPDKGRALLRLGDERRPRPFKRPPKMHAEQRATHTRG